MRIDPRQVALPSAREQVADVAPASNLEGCPEGVSCEQAARDLDEANRLIARAGEHPADEDWAEILRLLQSAADSGYLEAQLRLGQYVVGYWFTDEMFWPREPKIAIFALAMYRVAAKRGPDAKNDPLLRILAKDPVTFRPSDGIPPLPARWVKAALAEAKRWEKSHPTAVRSGL
jgi:hypothetical protein